MDYGRERAEPGFLASRRIYLKVALFLRGCHKGWGRESEGEYLHTPLTEALRLGVLECEEIRPVIAARMLSEAALYGNSSADVKKGSEVVAGNYDSLLDAIPYIRGSTAGADAETGDERERAIKKYREWPAKGLDKVKL